MSVDKENKPIWKDIILIVIGAILGSLPVLISSYMHEESQLHQIILDRRITALKEYSNAVNKFTTSLLPKLQKIEDHILSLDDKNNSDLYRVNFVKKYRDEFIEAANENQAINSEINTQILIINALFNSNIPLRQIIYFDPLIGNNKSTSEWLIDIKNDIIKLKKNIVNHQNKQSEIMSIFSSMIE